MKFLIESLILWPLDQEKDLRILNFKTDKVNIIHGRSRTGKSSILSIIDYCLGSSRCSIPVGLIREKVEWFGLIVHTKGIRIIIARHTPGVKTVSKEFFVRALNENQEIPKVLNANYDESDLKSLFNDKLLRLSNLSQSDNNEVGQFDGRASYRDLAAFNFLPQHIVANPNTLFYKADSNEHKERLRKILPLALSIVDIEYLNKERSRFTLQKHLESLERKQETKKRNLSAWEGDVEKVWNKAIELGLVQNVEVYNLSDRINILNELISKIDQVGYDVLMKTPNYKYTNEKYIEYKQKEINLQKDIDKLRRKIRNYEVMSQSANNFSEAINTEKQRIINFEWIKKNIKDKNTCIACGSENNQLTYLIDNLEKKTNKISGLVKVFTESPIAHKEIDQCNTELMKLESSLQEVRLLRLELERIDTVTKDSLSKVFILIGRLQALLINYAENNNEDELGKEIVELRKRIQELDNYFLGKEKLNKSNEVFKEISDLISFYASKFELEKPGTISLDAKDLTLSFMNKGRKEYLWEVGSGSNWMGYHISTFLGLHQYFSKEELDKNPVLSFLVIDQPSQVYFPTAVSGINQLDDYDDIENLKAARGDDILATRRIFEMLNLGLKKSSYQYQIIVLEHADQSIWGDVDGTYEVANWKNKDEGLIPQSWL